MNMGVFIALIPSYLLHIVVTTSILVLFNWMIGLVKKEKQLDFRVITLVGIGLSILINVNSLLQTYQAKALVKAEIEAKMLAGSEGAIAANKNQIETAEQNNLVKQDPNEKMRADFLATVDVVTSDFSSVTAESIKKLFEQFAPIFPQGEIDKTKFYNEINKAFVCQKLMFDEGLAVMKNPKFERTPELKNCFETEGEFFRREKMIPEVLVNQHDQWIELIRNNKAMNSVGALLTEQDIQRTLDLQIKKIENLNKLFQ